MAPSMVRPPLQERSRRTLERILGTTERLLLKRPFEEIGVQQIVRGARTSVGAFYARFEDKSALLGALYERYAQGLDERVAAWRSTHPDPGSGLPAACAWVARYLVDSFRERRHLLRALALHVRLRPEVPGASASRRRLEQLAFLEETLLRNGGEIPDADRERAVRTAIFLAACACRERILFSESTHARALEQSDDRLVLDLTRMMSGYLLGPDPRETPR